MKKLLGWVMVGALLGLLLFLGWQAAEKLRPTTTEPTWVGKLFLPITGAGGPSATPSIPTLAVPMPTDPPVESNQTTPARPVPPRLRFAVAADMRMFTSDPSHFSGAARALAQLEPVAFMIVPGDMDPPADLDAAIQAELGTDFIWYPVVGNHELPENGQEYAPGENMAWLRAWMGNSGLAFTRTGPGPCPETTYSFNAPPAHFVVLNQYCDSTSDIHANGDVSDELVAWLIEDLQATKQPYTFVIGHEPAFPQPDRDVSGPARHLNDSLDKFPEHRDRFWSLLAAEGVTAYLTGHTHQFSVFQQDGVWQVDAGHARGLADPSFPSTFLVFTVEGNTILVETYRGHPDYTLAHRFVLAGFRTFLPVIGK